MKMRYDLKKMNKSNHSQCVLFYNDEKFAYNIITINNVS